MKDLFSLQSETYARYRPTYPPELFTFLLSLVPGRRKAWDCGTGSGQIAMELANSFAHVYATDISENQIKNAIKKDNIFYKIEQAEKTSFPDHEFDLVTVAQAIHWFDFQKFYSEVDRVLKPGGILAVIGYYLPEIDDAIDKLVYKFYTETVGVYWDAERKYIDEQYQTIPFPFDEIQAPVFRLRHQWNREHLIGFLSSWSAVQHYMKQNNHNPVELIRDEIESAWKNDEQKEVNFPLLLRIGKKLYNEY